MQTNLSHLQINIRPENIGFYRDLMPFLGWPEIFGDEAMVGVGSFGGVSLWFNGRDV